MKRLSQILPKIDSDALATIQGGEQSTLGSACRRGVVEGLNNGASTVAMVGAFPGGAAALANPWVIPAILGTGALGSCGTRAFQLWESRNPQNVEPEHIGRLGEAHGTDFNFWRAK